MYFEEDEDDGEGEGEGEDDPARNRESEIKRHATRRDRTKEPFGFGAVTQQPPCGVHDFGRRRAVNRPMGMTNSAV